jgi:DNA-directed RNA polymerase subunit omega
MLDAFKEEKIVNKVGGRFKLSSLIQKRLVALNRGARPLVELSTKSAMEIVVAEIMNDKIFLDTSGNLAIAADGSPLEDVVPDDAGPSLEDL